MLHLKLEVQKKLNIPKIKGINPDLIIGNKEESNKEQLLELCENFPVWLSDIYTIQDSNKMILEIGKITDTESKAKRLINGINSSIQKLMFKQPKGKIVLYLIREKPYIAAGRNTFINDILIKVGYQIF